MKKNLKLKIFFFSEYIFIQFKFNLNISDEMKIEKYLIIYNGSKLLNEKKYFKKFKKPKASIISAVYNREKYLMAFL